MRMRGQAMVECIVVFPVLILLAAGIVQAGLLYHAQATLDNATLRAARAGAVAHGAYASLRDGLARGLAPMFATKTGQAAAQRALDAAAIEVGDSALTSVSIVNPTEDAFRDFARRDDYVGKTTLEIPNDTLMYRDPRPGSRSGMSIQDANLLKIRVTYCYDMVVPAINQVFYQAVRLLDGRSENRCVAHAKPTGQWRFPLTSEATVRMQTPFRLDAPAG
ncbi:TadE family protein [Trinickia mobilis]|uniref:TadE family protein n=1 Tax=Trinickia mobilis TaxID=2816356 RepID=UPI001F5D7F76|nr:TadE family protein [Trinickia mobilis]